jgi:acyl-CoA thioester hydrolase
VALSDGPACFRFDSPVYFDELDLLGVMHNSRFAVHVERAQSALFESLGYGWTDPAERPEDLCYVVASIALSFAAPVVAPGILRIEVVAASLGRTSATWGYRCLTPAAAGSSSTPAATGHRVVVKVDAATMRPVPWTDAFRSLFGRLSLAAEPLS